MTQKFPPRFFHPLSSDFALGLHCINPPSQIPGSLFLFKIDPYKLERGGCGCVNCRTPFICFFPLFGRFFFPALWQSFLLSRMTPTSPDFAPVLEPSLRRWEVPLKRFPFVCLRSPQSLCRGISPPERRALHEEFYYQCEIVLWSFSQTFCPCYNLNGPRLSRRIFNFSPSLALSSSRSDLGIACLLFVTLFTLRGRDPRIFRVEAV